MVVCPQYVHIDQDTEIAVCHPEGDLDARTSAAFREAAAQLCGRSRVVFDLSGLVFMDSCGLGALIGGIRRIREHGGTVVVCSGRRPISRLLRTVGLDRVVTVEDSFELAVRQLGGSGSTARC